jgi:hypothetical protein
MNFLGSVITFATRLIAENRCAVFAFHRGTYGRAQLRLVRRAIPLPFDPDPAQVDAKFDKGVLHIRLPKPAGRSQLLNKACLSRYTPVRGVARGDRLAQAIHSRFDDDERRRKAAIDATRSELRRSSAGSIGSSPSCSSSLNGRRSASVS